VERGLLPVAGMSRSRLRFAVIGQGHFAQIAVLPALEQLDDVELAALVSGSRHKLAELGARYNVRHLCEYGELDELLGGGGIDAVYIAMPNDLHAEMTVIAARHGVHVLCEKPMAPTEAECLQMIRACEVRKVKLMIGYRLHFEAANLVAIEIARGGELGDLRVFSSTLSMQVREGNTRVQPRRGAGPIYDIGTYCVNAARYLFRAEPIEVAAIAMHGSDARFTAVDEAVSALLRFPGDRIAQFTCSFGATDRSYYEVLGTAGMLSLDNAYESAVEMRMTVRSEHGDKLRTFSKRDQVAGEIEYFARCIRDDVEPEPSGWEGLADIRILQAIQQSARYGRTIQIEPVARPSRPDLGQEIRIPPHDKPALVDVQSGSK
jgi:glucose-fructose oxidoreductase